MKNIRLLSFALLAVICSSFCTSKNQEDIKITRYLLASGGYQIVQFENGIMSKTLSHKFPLQYKLYPNQVKQILMEYNQINWDVLEKELKQLPDLGADVYPKIFYEFTIDGEKRKTKEFLQRSTPKQLQKFDRMIYDLSSNMQ